MHFNPCGRAVDWIQFPFEVDAQLHNGAGAPLVRLRWVFTDLPFLPVGTLSVVNNRIWNADNVSILDVGQLPEQEANYRQDDRWILPPGFKPNHMCNSEWFATGEPWPNTLPPTAYDSYWIPTCCGPMNHFARGGFAVGGPISHAVNFGHTISGGVQLGGAITHAVAFVHSPRGGFAIGGAVVHALNIDHAPTGGVEIGGEVVHALNIDHAPTGGVVLGGEVVHEVAFEHTATGGVVLGGAITHTFNPGTPTPGTSCATAGAILPGQSYSGSVSIGTSNWFTFTETSGVQYTITVSGVTGSFKVSTKGLDGTCASLTTRAGPFNDNGNASWTAGSTQSAFIQISALGGGAYTVALTSP